MSLGQTERRFGGATAAFMDGEAAAVGCDHCELEPEVEGPFEKETGANDSGCLAAAVDECAGATAAQPCALPWRRNATLLRIGRRFNRRELGWRYGLRYVRSGGRRDCRPRASSNRRSGFLSYGRRIADRRERSSGRCGCGGWRGWHQNGCNCASAGWAKAHACCNGFPQRVQNWAMAASSRPRVIVQQTYSPVTEK